MPHTLLELTPGVRGADNTPIVARNGAAARICLLALVGILAGGVLWHVAYTGFDLGRGRLDDFMADWVFNLSVLVGAAIAFVHAARKETNRLVPALLGLAVLLWASADIYWTIVLKNLESPPYPSPADAGWLLFYVPAYVSLVLIVRRRTVSFLPSVWLDGLVASLVVAALAAAFVIDPIVHAAEGSLQAIATNLAYPLGDLVLVLFVVGAVALSGWRLDRQLLLLGSGFVLFAVADTGYLYRVATGSYEVGTVLDSLWLVALAVISVAALVPDGSLRAFRYEGWSVLVAPSALAMTAVGILVYGGLQPLPRVALACAAAAMLVAFLRAGLTFRDIRALAEVRREALTDVLTGLPNRRWFYRELATAVDADGERPSVALVMIDLDGFKELNDTLGHQTGDLVLEMVARRLADALEGMGTLARLGGDEFAVLVEEEAVVKCARRIQEGLAAGFAVGGFTFNIGASMGIAVYPVHALDAESLLRRADIAMYEAKRKRISHAFYSSDEDRYSLDRFALMSELRDAILAGDLTLVYQPEVEIPSGAVSGVEALVRWHHRERGEISPNEFVQLAEHAGLMPELTPWVLRHALRQCNSWRARGLDLTVSVNISAADLIDAEFDSAVKKLLDEENVPAQFLRLEITEHGLMVDPDGALEVCRRLSEFGVKISLDDFGTGVSSLEYLSKLPVDELKIDRSFVMTMGEAGSEIVRCAAQLGCGLGLNVVAEGVEDVSVLEQLVRYGCTAVQGYYFSPPLPPEQLEAWVRTRASLPASPELRAVGL